ncbi:uncharacterized protein PADG_03650 [Paracoccidioides brasiliensis Pb18]|uniref:Uncharacterized protein n=1 Tax=Paracoccidioides brasiliensis (strain Pb18) TaxID=502780 RepID=C1G8R4_PARBD|nr:uncharacterized protein PADG_03650 [Paracoccidioides brasiliensis Pb18]EEH47566.2 hypothetical protein PADG_03650 [Paracoccidioides brasiliensis Pb18]
MCCLVISDNSAPRTEDILSADWLECGTILTPYNDATVRQRLKMAVFAAAFGLLPTAQPRSSHHVVLSASSLCHSHHAVYTSLSSPPSQHYPASSIHESVLSHSLLVLSLSTVGSPWTALIMVSLSCLTGSDKQSSSKMDVLAALDSLSTLNAIISDSGYESGSISHDKDDDDVPDGGHPQLFIFLKPEFTKRFLGDKELNKFKIPEIIFDPTLVLSPHICLLTMLFHIGGFKSISTTGPVLDSAEKLYSVKVLNGKGQQPLLLKDELLDKFVFCQTELTSTGFKICLDKRMTPSMMSSRMRQAKEVTEALQNVMLQHADIRTFVKHYQVDVDVDAQGIVRKTGSQTELV